MKKAYNKAFNQIKEYLDSETLEKEPHALYYMNSCSLSLLNTAKAIATNKNIAVEKVTTVDIMRYFHELSDNISDLIDSAFDNYTKYQFHPNEFSNREREELKKQTTIDLSKFLCILKDFLQSSGALDHTMMQHNLKMSSLKLSKLSVTPEQLYKEFDFNRNSHQNIPTLITKSVFWINKAVKYIENLKLSILLFEKDNLPYTKENYDNFSDKDKIISILKEQILTKLQNDVSSQLPDDYSFNALLILYSAVTDYQDTNDTTRAQEYINNLPTIDPELAENLLTQLNEFHLEYDKIFREKNSISAFSKDMYCIGNNFSLEEDLYNYKDTLMILLANQLLEQRSLPISYINHYGNSYDSRLDNNLLTIDLPNYFMPASFHYDKKVTQIPTIHKLISDLPEYKGFFMNNSKVSLPTHVLFAPTEEQKKYIQTEFKKAKAQPDSQRTKILSQMHGMANGKWQGFDSLINKNKEH